MKRVILTAALVLVPKLASASPAAPTDGAAGAAVDTPLPPPEPAPASAPAPAPAPPAWTGPAFTAEPDRTPAPPPKPDAWRVGAGVRVGYVTDKGFDTFADSDVLTQFSLEGTYTLLRAGRLSLAAGLAYDVGGRSDSLRGADTKLTSHRFTVPIEARVAIAPWLEGFGRVAPGAGLLLTSVDDSSSPAKLTDTRGVFATDLSAGVSLLVPPGAEKKKGPHIWVTPEFGYAFSSSAKLSPDPGRDANDVLGEDAATRLEPVALGGFFWRIGASIAF
jgi:hypothetical protein